MFGKRSNESRTPEDRARAAAERAARRSGRALPPDAFFHEVPPPDMVEPEPAALDEYAEPPRAAEPPHAAEPPRAPEPPRAAARREPPAAEPPRAAEPHEPPHAAEPRGLSSVEPVVDITALETQEHRITGTIDAIAPEHAGLELDGTIAPDDAGRGLDDGAIDRVPHFGQEGEAAADFDFAAIEPREQPAAAAPPAPVRPVPPPRAPETPVDTVPVPAPPLRSSPRRPRGHARRGRGGPPAAPARPHGVGYWARRGLGVVVLLLIGALLYVGVETFQPLHGTASGAVAVDIPAGVNASKIGDILADKGIVSSGRFFAIDATVTGRRDGLHPGHYVLKRNMTYGAALDALSAGPTAAKVVPTFKLTLPEGPSRREFAATIAKQPIAGSYLKASASPSVRAQIRKLGAPKGTKTAEGFLFPATYDLATNAPASTLVDKQLQAFEDNFAQVDMAAAKRRHMTRYDVLIIASMIEREAELPKDRALISAVIYNRLKSGMPLGIDATIRYYTNNWQRPIRQSELQADEPYNTRIHHGLPPTPIGNPGLASLKAAAHPADKPYLYYVRKPGSSGAHAFSTTAAQFERDVRRYQASRGG